MSTAVSRLTIAGMLGIVDEELELCKGECDEFAGLQRSWIAEAVATNTKQLQYKSTREFECPRSHRKPAKSKRMRGLEAVSEEPEEKENATANPEERSNLRRALSSRSANAASDETCSKRKSDIDCASEGDVKRPRDETVRIDRDQLPEITAAAAVAAEVTAAASPRVTHAASSDPSKMKVAELRAELTRLGLSSEGRKDDLVARLLEHAPPRAAPAAPAP
eukprot:1883355-Prymnesium_polylepis.1